MSLPSFGINGFGRIGRTAARVWLKSYTNKSELKVINTSGSMELTDWAHLLKYDTNYGVLKAKIKLEQQQSKDQVSDDNPVLGVITISTNSNPIREHSITVLAQRDPAKIPWEKYGVETVIESTGIFNTQEKASSHFQGGAKQVILSAPPKGDNVTSIVIGVSDFKHQTSSLKPQIFSNESCTTNCVAPVAQIMVQNFGVEKAMMTTIHAYTDDQNLHDNSHQDLRRARSAAQNLVPTTTGAARATTRAIKELDGLFDGLAIRVPISVGSLADLTFVTKKTTSIEAVNQAFIEASQTARWQGILSVTNDPIVSSDIVGRSESSIVDLSLTNVVDGNLVKIISWYDNEWGYCHRLIEQISHLSS